ncbi:MAG TPA: polysaccharide deacetylase family protein [Candidatus Nitrosotenuis sp.]|nr:polysaccharide deacetylase family protein [Candidatus Nitrosotenuis sp.]
MIDIRLATILVVACVMAVPYASAQESTGTLSVYLKNEKNERAAPDGVSIKVYMDQQKTVFREIAAIESNPFAIPSLPLKHNYRIEIYVNSMYADVGYVTMQQPNQNLEISIKNAGGLLLNVFYKDGETPLQGAQVWIKSQDGKTWSYSETAQNGQTIRTWLYPTTNNGFYYAEVSLGRGLQFVYTPIKLQPGIAQDFKVVTNWPVVVDKLFPVEVYNSTKNKVTRQDGSFIAELYDSKKNKVAEAAVTDKGVANLSKLKVGNYALYIKAKDAAGEIKTVAGKKVTITEDTGTIKIYLNNPELNSEHLNCNCVAFRLDDIQDYFLAPSQIEVISLFEKKKVPLTVGVIGGLIGADQRVVTAIKNGMTADPPIEVASHSWNNKVLTSMTKKEQEDMIKQSSEKIRDLFGVKPTTFIPPENLLNNDTLAILKNNGYTHVSYATTTREPPAFKKADFYHFPAHAYTARLNPQNGFWEPASNQQILEKIEDSIFEYGYAVVMMHPYEFANYEEGFYVNKVNTTAIEQLSALIDKIQSQNRRILTIGSIQDYDKPVRSEEKPPTENQTLGKLALDCNCVAFRLDNIQDFWLNEVQNGVVDMFDKNGIPVTLTVIGKYIGDDPKVTDFLKNKLDSKTSKIRLANRGWEYVDHTTFDEEKQAASMRQTNDRVAKLFGVKLTVFSPPYDAFNKDTLEAMKQTKLEYLSASIANDRPPFGQDSLKHAPSTISFNNLISDDPFYSGTMQQKALAKIQNSIKQNGYALVSLQPSDLAIKTDAYTNEIDASKAKLLNTLLDDIKSSGISIVPLEAIPRILDERSIVIPDWVRSNAQWWADDKIGDSDFTKGLEYLIEQKIIQIPATQQGPSSGQKIPSWIKSNAKWWAEGKIGNSDFVKGIQYLIQNGIIQV